MNSRTLISVSFIVLTARAALAGAPHPNALGEAVGRPKGILCIPVLLTDGSMPSNTFNIITVDGGMLQPLDPVINPAIGTGSSYGQTLDHGSAGCDGPNCTEFYTISGGAALPDGLLYTAVYEVNCAVGTGTFPLGGDPSGSFMITNCAGDCDGNGEVSIGEVQSCVARFLGAPLCDFGGATVSCPVADGNGDKGVSLGEVQDCVNRFFSDCDAPGAPIPRGVACS